MKICMGIITFICLLAVLAYGGENQPSKQPLELKLSVITLGEKTLYKLILVNISDEEVTVISKSLDRDSDDDLKGNFNVTFGGGNSAVEYQGVKLVSSFYAFHPVTLQPKEGTILEITSEAFPTPFEDLENAETITISYEIAEDWAKRHHTWSGKVSTQVLHVEDGKIVVPDKGK